MALGSPNGLGFGASGDAMREQIARLYALSSALRQQSGFGASPMQAQMKPPTQYQPGNVMPMQPPQMQQGMPQQGGGMDMLSMLPMLMMMRGGGSGLGSGGWNYPGGGAGMRGY